MHFAAGGEESQSSQQCRYHRSLLKDAAGIFPQPDGQARGDRQALRLPSAASVLTINPVSLVLIIDVQLENVQRGGPGLAEMGIGEKLWCFPLSSV